MPPVTIRDVAREAGVSVSSVSRILRGGQGHVYPSETHERVREVANRIGYRPNVAARLLSQNTRTMIGMAVHFTEHPYLNRFLVAVRQELLKRQYDPVFLDADHLASDSMIQPFPPAHMLAGLISVGLDLQVGWPKHYAAMRQHLPIVALMPVDAQAATWVDMVRVDYAAAYTEAIRHLTELGHRNIAFCGAWDEERASHIRRLEGWKRAAAVFGINPGLRIDWKINPPEWHPEEGLEEADFIFQRGSLESLEGVVEQLESFPERVTAVVVSGDELALALQSFLQSKGKRVPQDISIVGYDGISLGAYFHPGLTTIAPRYREMAATAVDLLQDRIQEFDPKQTLQTLELTIAPQLAVRTSTGPAPSP